MGSQNSSSADLLLHLGNKPLSEMPLRDSSHMMSILSGFFSNDLAIDLGTVNTILYNPTQGVFLSEPSIVAINKYTRKVVSVVSEALKLIGREPNDIEVCRPIRRGAIDNF